MSLTAAPSSVPNVLGLGPPTKRWTVDEYHQLIEHGLILDGAPLELIDGELRHKDRGEGGQPMSYGPRHAFAVGQLASLNERLRPLGLHMRNQVPLTILPNQEPEPDGAVVRGDTSLFRDRNPEPADCCLVVEVADTSLSFDRTIKQRIYASAAIPVYWIVNLRNNTIEVYEQPDAAAGEYRVRRDRQLGETVEIVPPGWQAVQIRVEEILG